MLNLGKQLALSHTVASQFIGGKVPWRVHAGSSSRRTPLARLKPFPQSDRFELFYWSDMRGRWRTFGDFGRLRLTLERAHEIFREETIFHIHATR